MQMQELLNFSSADVNAILVFSSNANTFEKYLKYFSKYFDRCAVLIKTKIIIKNNNKIVTKKIVFTKF